MCSGGRADLATGEVWPAPAVDYAREIGQEDEDESDDPDKWLWVHCEGSRDGYRSATTSYSSPGPRPARRPGLTLRSAVLAIPAGIRWWSSAIASGPLAALPTSRLVRGCQRQNSVSCPARALPWL